jgi:putative hydrolase of the HAD superfamily
MEIKNIIFDLGGVLLDISVAKTRDAFIQSGVLNFDDYFQQAHSNALFTDLEKGLITPDEFCNLFRADTGVDLSDEVIKANWNALLGTFRTSSINLLPALKENYKLFLFSNTNLIHYEAFISSFVSQYGHDGFNNYFDRAYYSHNMNQRKPDPASFLYIVNENNLLPQETLFVDDSYVNIEGAQKAGLQTLWLQNGSYIEDALPALLNGH